jgi:hypothetical protein
MDAETKFKRKPNGMAEDLGAVIGFSNTVLVCGIWGGKTLYVPEKAGSGHRLAGLLGATAFARLVEEFGGETLTIPALADFGRWQRIRKAATLRLQGRSLHCIAALTGVTYQQVKNDIRSAELLGLIPLVLCADRRVKSDAEVIRQMGFEGF